MITDRNCFIDDFVLFLEVIRPVPMWRIDSFYVILFKKPAIFSDGRLFVYLSNSGKTGFVNLR